MSKLSQSFLLYDSKTLPIELIEEFEKLLSTSLSVKRIDVSKRVNHSPLAFNWLEIAFIFVSSSIASSILKKFGDDLYLFIKKKLIKRNKSDEMRITLSINAKDIFVQGRIISSNYTLIANAIQTSNQILLDALEKKKHLNNEIDLTQAEGIAKQTPVFESGIWFNYEYDTDRNEWTLKRITNYKPDSKSGQFYAKEGEEDRVIM